MFDKLNQAYINNILKTSTFSDIDFSNIEDVSDRYSNVLFAAEETLEAKYGGKKLNNPSLLLKIVNDTDFDDVDSSLKNEVIKLFNNYLGYFDKYCVHKEVLYSLSDKHGSIFTRVFIENYIIYLENINRIEKLLEVENVEDLDYSFINKHYSNFISYLGKAEYNKKVSKINSALNLKIFKTLKRIPLESIEFKNELASSDGFFKMIMEEMISNAQLSIQKIKETIGKDLFKKNIYISTTRISRISFNFLDNWKTIREINQSLDISDDEDFISLTAIQSRINSYNLDSEKEIKNIHDCINIKINKLIEDVYTQEALIESGIKEYVESKSNKSKQIIHDYCQAVNDLVKTILSLDSEHDNNDIQIKSLFEYLREESSLNYLYNQARNIVTKKFVDIKNIQLNFDRNNLAKGWDIFKIRDYGANIFKRDNSYYLGILTKGSESKLDYISKEQDSENISNKKALLKKDITTNDIHNSYQMRVSKSLKNMSRMIPKCIIKPPKAYELYGLSKKIENIYNLGEFKGKTPNKKHLEIILDYYIKTLNRHEDWSKFFDFSSLKKAHEYKTYVDFLNDVEGLCYSVSWDNIKDSYIDEMIINGELLLFKLSARDINKSKKSKNTKAILDAIENHNDVQLLGGTNISYRDVVIDPEKAFRHKKGEKMQFRNAENSNRKEVFKYDIIKDKRYTEEKYFATFKVALNASCGDSLGNYKSLFNKHFNQFNDPREMNIMAITRGEWNLLYFTISDNKGNIIEQSDLNIINNIDYKDKLYNRTQQRKNERKNWLSQSDIKNLKKGYLQFAIGEIIKKVIQHDCILVLENIDTQYIQSRKHIEHQVYNEFIVNLAKRLNYVKTDDGYLQLTPEFKKLSDLDYQFGCMFFIKNNVNNIDPVTQFKALKVPPYENIKKTKKFFISTFNSIKYCNETNAFIFNYEDKDLITWDISSRVSRYIKNEKGFIELYNSTKAIKEILVDGDIDIYNKNILEEISKKDITSKSFWLGLLNSIRIINKMINHNAEAQEENKKVYFSSPVAPYFDTRIKNEISDNIDGVTTYNIIQVSIDYLKKIIK